MSTDTSANVTPIPATLQELAKTDEFDWGRFTMWWIAGALVLSGGLAARVDARVTVVHFALVAGLVWTGYARRPAGRAARLVAPLVLGLAMYWEVPMLIVAMGTHYHDTSIQQLEHFVFGTQPSRVLAAALPSWLLSEVLHAGYLAFYPAIVVPPALLCARREWRGVAETVAGLTLTMTICWFIFVLFPVEGPRYEWTAPVGVFDGPMRRFALMLVGAGSARGAAFPSSHMAICVVQAVLALRWQPRMGAVLVVLSALIGLGAVYGGFHYAVDMIAGAALGVGVGAIVVRCAPMRAGIIGL